jgi:hypothetical protein
MNQNQIDNLVNTILEYIIASDSIKVSNSLSFEIFSSTESTKLPIYIHSVNERYDFFVYDYFQKDVLEMCIGTNGDKRKLRLNCEDGFNHIYYSLDQNLTGVVNKRFGK